MDADQPDLVDVFYRPYVRALGNLVITFAQAEAAFLGMVSELLAGDEMGAVVLLKAPDAKERVLEFIASTGLSDFELNEMIEGVDHYWIDKEERNRFVHDEWYPNLDEEEGPLGSVATRGITRKKPSAIVHRKPSVTDVWQLAFRFRDIEACSQIGHGCCRGPGKRRKKF